MLTGKLPPPASPYAAKGWQDRLTKLTPEQEAQFGAWAKQTGAPLLNDKGIADYDMRGFWLNDRDTGTQINQNDGLPHYIDKWKTPYHKSFGKQSTYADPATNPPDWNEQDQLVTPDGTVLYDEKLEAIKAELMKRLNARDK